MWMANCIGRWQCHTLAGQAISVTPLHPLHATKHMTDQLTPSCFATCAFVLHACWLPGYQNYRFFFLYLWWMWVGSAYSVVMIYLYALRQATSFNTWVDDHFLAFLSIILVSRSCLQSYSECSCDPLPSLHAARYAAQARGSWVTGARPVGLGAHGLTTLLSIALSSID